MQKLAVAVIVISIAGCATTPSPNALSYSARSAAVPSVELNKTRLTIYRPSGIREMRNADAYLRLNDSEVASIGAGSFVTIDVPQGSYMISVKALGTAPCRLPVSSTGGNSIFFEVVPRQHSPSIGVGALFGAIGVLAASAIEASSHECGGEFNISQVSSDYAIPMLQDVREIESDKHH